MWPKIFILHNKSEKRLFYGKLLRFSYKHQTLLSLPAATIWTGLSLESPKFFGKIGKKEGMDYGTTFC